MIPIGVKWILLKKGWGASAHLEAGGFIRSREGLDHPDIQFHFLPTGVVDHGRVNIDRHAFQVMRWFLSHFRNMLPTIIIFKINLLN